MSRLYRLEGNRLTLCEDSTPPTPFVCVCTHAEFIEDWAPALNRPIAVASLEKSHACHVDLFDESAVGNVSLPDKEHLDKQPTDIGFYLDRDELIVVDDTPVGVEAMDRISQLHHRDGSLGRVFFLFLESLIVDDGAFLEKMEQRVANIENALMSTPDGTDNRALLHLHRDLLRLDYYYEQLSDVGSILEDNGNEVMSDSDAKLFGIFARHADRLYDRTRTCKEFSLQMQELQQTHIDLRQNKTMQWLTVVTSIFVPMTLITSWYGMNFKDMPELDWAWGYPLVFAICLALAVGELIFFKHRKWL